MLNSAFERGDYDHLYANYMNEAHSLLTERVREIVADSPVNVAVDLCAGTGAMTLPLMRMRVPQVYAVDKSPALLFALRCKIQPLDLIDTTFSAVQIDLNREGGVDFVKGALTRANDYQADLVTCRQSVGYLSEQTLLSIPRLLAPGGSFIFNTFVEPPKGHVWLHRRGGGIYEAGLYVLGKVFHLQARWPRVDATVFRWHDVEALAETWRGKSLLVNTEKRGRTLIVTVTRPQPPTFH